MGDLDSADGTHFGVQVLREDDTVYVFGTRREGVFRSAILARVAPGDIAEPRAYQYLASPEPVWTGDVTAATSLTSCDSEYSVSFNPFLNRYLMTYVDGYEKALYIRTAPKPWGPYTERQLLGRLPYRDQSEMISLGFEHPKFSQEGGRTVVVSYCQPHFTQNSLVAVTTFGEPLASRMGTLYPKQPVAHQQLGTALFATVRKRVRACFSLLDIGLGDRVAIRQPRPQA